MLDLIADDHRAPGVERATKRPGVVAVEGDRLESLQRAAQQARDVHLRDADPLGDLGLGQVVDRSAA